MKMHESGLPELDTKELMPKLVNYMLQAIHTRGKDVEKDAQIEKAWQKFNNIDMPMMVNDRDTLRPWYLRGFPGHGKTTVMVQAAKKVAKLLNANFVFRPGDSFNPTKNDFVFNVLELAGESSNVTIGGIPAKELFVDESGVETPYMVKLPSKALASMKSAGFAFLLLDDFANAAMPVQTALLSALLDNKMQNLDLGTSVAFGLAGNMGSADGTKGISDTASITGRVQTCYVADSLENYRDRLIQRYSDNYRDAHLAGFLTRYPELFFKPETVKANGVPHTSSRQWDALAALMRQQSMFFEYKTKIGEKTPFQNPLDEIYTAAASLVGGECAEKLRSHMMCLWQYEAAPTAKDIIINNKGLEVAIVSKVAGKLGDLTSGDEMDWGYRFAGACSDYAADAFYESYKKGNTADAAAIVRNFGLPLFGMRNTSTNEYVVLGEDQTNYMMSSFISRLGMLDVDRTFTSKAEKSNELKTYLKFDVINLLQDELSKNPLAFGAGNSGKARITEMFSDIVTHQDLNESIDDYAIDLDKLSSPPKTAINLSL